MKPFYSKRFIKHFDWSLFFVSIIILSIGLLSIYSSTKTKGASHGDFYKQLAFVIPALIACFVATLYDYSKLKNYVKFIYWSNIALLGFVLFAGHSAYGAQRWIIIAGITIQPSELAKIAIIITLADFLVRKPPNTMKDLLPVFIHVLIPTLLIFKQPDLGTSLSLIAITFGMLYAAELSILVLLIIISPAISAVLYLINFPLWILYLIFILGLIIFFIFNNRAIISKSGFKQKFGFHYIGYLLILLINIGGGLLTSFVWSILKDYQKQRILVFLNPEADPLGAGYNIAQSQIAIGSGGLFGKGLLHGTQTQLNFVPFQHTDFVFSVICEEFGFIGSLYILLLFFYLIWRGLSIASKSSDQFGRLMATGIISMFVFHIFVNVGMISGILPAKGLPLPLMSYGGTFLVITMFSVGLLESIAIRQQRLMFTKD